MHFDCVGDQDWSQYALWWPAKQTWLSKPKLTLYAYGITSNATLEFTCVHRQLTIELPSKTRYIMRVHFAMMTFYVVKELCDAFGLRHPEELSLMKSPFDKEGFVKSTGYHKAKVKKLHDAGSRETSPGYEGSDSPPGSPGTPRKGRMKSLAQALEHQDPSISGGGAGTGAVIVRKVNKAPDGGFFSERLHRSNTEKAYINGL